MCMHEDIDCSGAHCPCPCDWCVLGDEDDYEDEDEE